MKIAGPERSFRIRPTTPADGERVAAMCAGLSAAEGLGIASRFTADAFRRDGFGADPAFSCLVADVDGDAIGYALYCRDYDTDRLCRSVYLADLYVESAARGWGIGRALMAAVARDSRAWGARVMMWSVLKSNRTARRFYAAIGDEISDQIETGAVGERFHGLVADSYHGDGVSMRTAEPDDAPVLARFLEAMLADIDLPRRPGAADRFRADGFGRDPAFTAVIAERAGTPLGYALFWPTYDTESAARGGWLSDLYVAPAARRHGVARQLLVEVTRRTAARGGRYLVWLVHANNQGARAFYRRYAEEWHDGLACICAGERFHALADSAMRFETAENADERWFNSLLQEVGEGWGGGVCRCARCLLRPLGMAARPRRATTADAAALNALARAAQRATAGRPYTTSSQGFKRKWPPVESEGHRTSDTPCTLHGYPRKLKTPDLSVCPITTARSLYRTGIPAM